VLRIAPKGRFDSPSAAALSALIAELSRVLADLRELQGSGLQGVPLDGSVEVWKDADHVYIEGRLPSDLGADVDVTVHGGTIFIRLDR
jgi:hypothetical protein